MQPITPFLWFTREAEAAARHYVSIFPDSRIHRVVTSPIETPSGPPGSVVVVDFSLNGCDFSAMSAGPLDPFNHAISLVVPCDSQDEIDRIWDGLLEGGQAEACGWLRDRYGVAWQIVPARLAEMSADPDRDKARRVWAAMMTMIKLDAAELERAYAGG